MDLITVLKASLWKMLRSKSHLQINAPWSCNGGWSGKAGGARIDNVKLIGWKFADGIYSGARSHVTNVFTKVNDDGVKPFESDTLYEKLTIWQQQNGWAIMLSWLSEGLQSNITVRDATVIHDGHGWDWSVDGCDPCRPNQATIGAVHGGSSTIQNVLVENIILETKVWRPVWFGIDKSFWAQDGNGILKDWTIRNIQVQGGAEKDSEVLAGKKSDQIDGILFDGFNTESHFATSCQDAHIHVLGATKDVKIAAPKHSPSVCAPTPSPFTWF